MADSRIKVQQVASGVIDSILEDAKTVRVTDTVTGNSSERMASTSQEATRRASEDVRSMNRASGN